MTVGVLWHVSHLQTSLIESTAITNARLYIQALSEFRTLYTTEVVERAIPGGIEVVHDYASKDGAIPLPYTLSMMLGEKIGKESSGAKALLYSAYPFPWRKKDGGLQDDFARDAWTYLRKYPNNVFYRFEDYQGQQSFRYATPDLMRPGCIKCHNTYPGTPKTDWKVGDVRGILEVIYPMSPIIKKTRNGLKETFALLLAISTIGVISLVLIINRLQRDSTKFKQLHQETHLKERELQKSDTRLRAVMKSAVDAIILSDSNGKILSWNNGAKQVFGYQEQEVLNQPITLLIPPELHEAHIRGIERVNLTGETKITGSTVEVAGLRKDGTVFPLEISLSSWQIDGEWFFSGIIRDIVQRKEAEDELKRLNTELQEANAELGRLSHIDV